MMLAFTRAGRIFVMGHVVIAALIVVLSAAG
jgi:hypothetical protein